MAKKYLKLGLRIAWVRWTPDQARWRRLKNTKQLSSKCSKSTKTKAKHIDLRNIRWFVYSVRYLVKVYKSSGIILGTFRLQLLVTPDQARWRRLKNTKQLSSKCSKSTKTKAKHIDLRNIRWFVYSVRYLVKVYKSSGIILGTFRLQLLVTPASVMAAPRVLFIGPWFWLREGLFLQPRGVIYLTNAIFYLHWSGPFKDFSPTEIYISDFFLLIFFVQI